MKSLTISMAILLSGASAFTTVPTVIVSKTTTTTVLGASYVPDGLSKQQYEQIKEAECSKDKGKNLGALGPKGFKSRSLMAWQKAYEKGDVNHTFAPIDYKKQLQQGKLRPSDIPYMVRGGNWDNSDVKGAKKLPWTKEDVEYVKGGYKKEQSASILGSGPGLDWTGSQKPDASSPKRAYPGFF
jgi:hypothetical protein